MISNNERREVAESLRGLDVAITSHYTLEGAVDKFMKAVYGERPFSPVRYSVRNLCGLGCVLADLIDPTCTVETREYGATTCRVCSECGWPIAPDMSYCPGCGARVVSGDGD